MNTAAIIREEGRLTCCVLPDTAHARYFNAHASDAARRAICQTLITAAVQEVVLVQTRDGLLEPVGYQLLLHRIDVWLAPSALLEDITGLLPRRPGTRTRAAIIAALPKCPTWLACLTPLSLPPTSPAQLGLF